VGGGRENCGWVGGRVQKRTADRTEYVVDKQLSPLMFRGESSPSGQHLFLGLRFGKLNLCITQMSSRNKKVMASLLRSTQKVKIKVSRRRNKENSID